MFKARKKTNSLLKLLSHKKIDGVKCQLFVRATTAVVIFDQANTLNIALNDFKSISKTSRHSKYSFPIERKFYSHFKVT